MSKKSLHEKNINIHKNLWKIYTFGLFLSIILIFIKGFN